MFRRKEEVTQTHESARSSQSNEQSVGMTADQLPPPNSLRQRPVSSGRSGVEESPLLRKSSAPSAQKEMPARPSSRFERPQRNTVESTPMRMPLGGKEAIPSPAVEDIKQSIAEHVSRAPSKISAPAAPASRSMNERNERNFERTGERTNQRVLTVGMDTVLKGEIATCDRLIVEGTVDAVLSDVHTIEIAESGVFKGSAIVEDAEISGHFDGDLDVKGCLTLYNTGRITGKVSYSEIEIMRGGIITGKIMLAGENNDKKNRQGTLLADGSDQSASKKSEAA